MLLRGLIGSVGVLALVSGAAQAASFTAQQADTFADCLTPLSEFAKANEDAFTNDDIELVKDGKIAIYSAHIAALKADHPDLYKSVDGISKTCGFSGADEFAAVGDPVMAAYMARDIEPMPAEMQNMPPEMLAHMPPMAIQGFAMAKALAAVPADDIALISDELAAKLEAASDEFGPPESQNPNGGFMGGMGQNMGGMPH